ncbi:hypothetical protein [Billgrantia endophytica]|uniref:Uncharacterized protein n=1 Tax=Billgrantia endophytica TaxID=2033802 RepID=A0A2N7TUC4_9GAMM|nr:hypothetical protein [Halomonas endophytica]PMR71787.1 hypothetical protein C1H69_22910 [Halomonas endophytica]
MEKEFEIKIKQADKQAMRAIFRTKHSDLELDLPLDNGAFDFNVIENTSNSILNQDKEGQERRRDSNMFIESVSTIIHDRFYKEIELHGEPRTDLAELMESVQDDIQKGFNNKLKELGVNQNVDDIEVKFTDGSTTFNDYSGGDVHQFCFEVSHLNKLSKFEIFVSEENPSIKREGLQKDYGTIFGSNERFNYVMDQIDVQIEQQIKEEQEMDFEPHFDAPEKEPEPKSKKSKKRDRGHGFSM